MFHSQYDFLLDTAKKIAEKESFQAVFWCAYVHAIRRQSIFKDFDFWNIDNDWEPPYNDCCKVNFVLIIMYLDERSCVVCL